MWCQHCFLEQHKSVFHAKMSDLFQLSNLSYWPWVSYPYMSWIFQPLHVLNARFVLNVQSVLIHHLVPVLILSHVLNVQPVKTAQPVLNIPIIQHALDVLVALIVLTSQPVLNVQITLHILCIPLVALQLVLNALHVLIVQPVLNSLFLHLGLMISCVLTLQPVLNAKALSVIQLLNVLIHPITQHWCQ